MSPRHSDSVDTDSPTKDFRKPGHALELACCGLVRIRADVRLRIFRRIDRILELHWIDWKALIQNSQDLYFVWTIVNKIQVE